MAKGNLQYAVLGVVGGHPQGMHGYQLKSELDVLCDDFWEVNFGRIYRALDELERNGDLLAERREQSDRPNRKVYRITERGRQTLDDWLLQPLSDSPQPLRDELSLKLLFLRDRDCDAVAEMIMRQRSIYLTRMARVAKRRTRLSKNGFDEEIAALVIEGAEMRIHAELAWLDHIERSLPPTCSASAFTPPARGSLAQRQPATPRPGATAGWRSAGADRHRRSSF